MILPNIPTVDYKAKEPQSESCRGFKDAQQRHLIIFTQARPVQFRLFEGSLQRCVRRLILLKNLYLRRVLANMLNHDHTASVSFFCFFFKGKKIYIQDEFQGAHTSEFTETFFD